MGTVRYRSYTMKQFTAVCGLLMVSAIGGALGRYIVIEVDDEIPAEPYFVPNPYVHRVARSAEEYDPYYGTQQVYRPAPVYVSRMARSAFPQEDVGAPGPLIRAQPPNPENRRNAPPPPPPPYGGPAPVFEIPAELRQNGDAIAAGSNNYARWTSSLKPSEHSVHTLSSISLPFIFKRCNIFQLYCVPSLVSSMHHRPLKYRPKRLFSP